MRRSWLSLGDDTQSIEKQDRMRAENALRPPPGGAIAASSCMSLTSFGSQDLRSYQNPLSTQSFRSSRGGMNPNTDFCGMLRSSMKATRRLPPTGANTPLLRFSSLPSMVSCSRLSVSGWQMSIARDQMLLQVAFVHACCEGAEYEDVWVGFLLGCALYLPLLGVVLLHGLSA